MFDKEVNPTELKDSFEKEKQNVSGLIGAHEMIRR